MSGLTTPNLQHTANQERNDQCGKQHHSCELLMMGIVMPETCWAHKKSSWFFILQFLHNNFKKEMKRNLYIVRNSLESLMFGMITNVSSPWILRIHWGIRIKQVRLIRVHLKNPVVEWYTCVGCILCALWYETVRCCIACASQFYCYGAQENQ